jgi:outer membrane protein TolC
MTLISQVTVAYLEVLSARGTLDAALQSLAALAVERDRIDQLMAQGQAARVQRLRVDAAYAETEAERIAAAAGLDTGERRLARLLGLDVERARAGRLAPVRLAEGLRHVEERATLIRRFEDHNPELAEVRRLTEAAEQGRRAAAAAWWPRLDVAGAYLLFGSKAFEFEGEWQVGLRLSYPLFTGGQRARAVSEAGARAAEARAQYELARLRGHEAVDRALAAVEEQRARVEAIATAVEHLGEVARIERLALEAGRGTQTDYLGAEASLRRARASLVQARHAEIAARVELGRVAGELTPRWLSTMLETIP